MGGAGGAEPGAQARHSCCDDRMDHSMYHQPKASSFRSTRVSLPECRLRNVCMCICERVTPVHICTFCCCFVAFIAFIVHFAVCSERRAAEMEAPSHFKGGLIRGTVLPLRCPQSISLSFWSVGGIQLHHLSSPPLDFSHPSKVNPLS